MKFGRGLDPFLKCFFICGLSCYPSYDDFSRARAKYKSFMKLVPTGILIVLTVIISIGSCVSKFLSDPELKSGASNLFINTLTLMVTVIVSAIRMVFLSPLFAEISAQMSFIERSSWRKFSIDLNAFRRHFMRRAYITLISFILPVVVKLSAKPFTWNNFILIAGLASLRGFMFLISMHAFFYVDLLDHMLQSFVRHVDMRATTATAAVVHTISFRSPAAKQMAAEILHFKLLHFNLWEITEKINHLFGWTIVIVFLQHFSYAIYNVYAAYMAMTMAKQPLNVSIFLRKSIGCFGGDLERYTFSLHFCWIGPAANLWSSAFAVVNFLDVCYHCSIRVMNFNRLPRIHMLKLYLFLFLLFIHRNLH